MKTFADFPKQRPLLPPKFEAIYSEHCNTNRNGKSAASGLSQKMESWMHRKVAADMKDGKPKSTLEIGAGTLNHLVYEPAAAPYDIVEPTPARYRTSADLHRIRNIYEDAGEVPATSCYDRIISIAAFEHICNLPDVIARCG